jgi:mannose-1-phosphate guanylyltransferase/phosphomannomutase
MKAVIMAGGKGTRLRPLTAHIPKPMVPILNKPCMSYSIGLLKRHGITEIAVTVQHLAPQIKAYFGDGSDFGVSLHYFDETKPLGTAGSVRNAASYLNERFVVISGDALTDYDLSDAIHFHEQKKALATILMAQVDFPLEYGVIMTDEQGIVTRFIEKPSWREVFSDTVNTGIYILEPDIFNYYESHIEYDFSKQLFPLFLDQKLPLFGYHATGYWSDIGNLNSYRQTQFDMLQGKVNLPIDAHEIAPQVFVESGSQIESGVHIKGPALIGANSQIKSDTVVGPFTVIGSHNLISTSASIEQSILWDSNVIMEAVQIEGATICSHNKIGTSSRVLEGGVLGNGCHIGPHVNIHEQVKLWPKKNIQANAEVTQSIVWGERESVHMFNRYGLSGVVETEMTPELVSKISASLSYYYQPGRTLVLSCVDHGYASVIKRLLIAGLQARGIHVVDIGIAAHSVHSYAIQSMQLDGGLHLFIEAEAGNPRRLCIQC